MFQGRPARLALSGVGALLLLTAAPAVAGDRRAAASADFPDIGYATWSDREPEYRLYPGDEVDIRVPSAPELDRTAVVQPDGRIILPLIAPVMAADRSVEELADALGAAYAEELLHPEVEVSVKTAGPLKVFVGGEVDKPGVYDMAGDTDALRAIIEAGGFKTSGNQTRVVIIRRGPGGRAMMRTVDLKRALKARTDAELVPLRRFDIVYVPRTGVAEAGVFVQQYFRDLLPGQFGFSYTLGTQTLATAVP
ncbi:MAG TPA: polysaccharide biosynthesis/export family protein [Caulobacteraceae bacterium]